MKHIITALLITNAPAMAEIKNDDLHAPGSFIISNSVNLYLFKTRPDLTYWQRYKRSFAACMAVGVGIEAIQGISGSGTADWSDVGRDAIGCTLQINWEWKWIKGKGWVRS